MAEENKSTQEVDAGTGKVTKAKSIISTKALFSMLLVLTIILIIYFSKNIYFTKTDEYKQQIYSKVNQSILQQYEVMQKEKLNTSVLISASLSKDTIIKKALKLNNSSLLDMDKLLAEMRTTSEYVDIEAEVIDKDGISFKRSWTYLAGDDLVKDDPKMAHLIKYPRVYTAIEASKYGLNMTNKIPIYDNDTFLGLFGVNIHFNALVSVFTKQGFRSVIILNRKDSAKIVQDISFSKQFIGDYYVVNSNADKYLMRIIQQGGVSKFYNDWDQDYIVDEQTGYLISKYEISSRDVKNIASVIIFRSLDDIDFEDLSLMQEAHIIATVLAVVLVIFFVYFLYILARIKELIVENEKLVVVNNELESKTSEMDFNDKKLDNLFNAQPNLMFMHNGREITKVNKRFMGFFNRFGDFEGFKKKHKCVSELFEKYEAPNYIWEQYIEGYFWIDYILKYPRRLYKVVMSIDGDPHHFIIKLNEMDYAKHVDERLIIVALVDMTQDLVNYKTLEESTQDLKDIQGLKDKLEVKEEKPRSDVSFILKTSVEDAINVLTNYDVKEFFVDKTDYHSVKNLDFIKVEGELNFSTIETQWIYFVPKNILMSLKKILNKDLVEDELVNIAQRVIYTMSKYFCDYVNEKHLHDLTEGNYGVASVKEIKGTDLAEVDNLYRITIKLNDKFIVEIFTVISNEIAPFLEQIVKAKPIKDLSEKDDTIKAVEPKVSRVEKKIEENKIVQEVQPKSKKEAVQKVVEVKSVESKVTQKPSVAIQPKIAAKKPTQTRLDPYMILQKSFHDYLINILSCEVTVGKLSPIEPSLLSNHVFVEFDNVFRIISQNKNIPWRLLLPASSLSLIFNIMIDDKDGKISDSIDDGLKDIAHELVSSISKALKNLTKDQVKLIASKGIIVDKVSLTNDTKIYNLGLKVEQKNLPIFILYKSNSSGV